MAKVRRTKLKLDMMSVTVLLVMSIFGGVIGYYLGRGASAAQNVSFREAASLMREKGAMMEEAGKLMDQRGKYMGDREMMDTAIQLMENGSLLTGKGTGMMGILSQ